MLFKSRCSWLQYIQLSFCVYPKLGWDCILIFCICVFQSLGHELVEAAAQAPSKQLQDLQKALAVLATEHAALNEQMASKQSGWEQEKARILKALKSERVLRKEAQRKTKEADRRILHKILCVWCIRMGRPS